MSMFEPGLKREFREERHTHYAPHSSPTKKFRLGDRVKKIRGSQWHGTVVGTYSTELTPEGYCVESATERGSVQIYPAAALEKDYGTRPTSHI